MGGGAPSHKGKGRHYSPRKPTEHEFSRNWQFLGQISPWDKIMALERCNPTAFSTDKLTSWSHNEDALDAMMYIATGWQPGTDLPTLNRMEFARIFQRVHMDKGSPLLQTTPEKAVADVQQMLGLAPLLSYMLEKDPKTDQQLMSDGLFSVRMPAGSTWTLQAPLAGEGPEKTTVFNKSHNLLAASFFTEFYKTTPSAIAPGGGQGCVAAEGRPLAALAVEGGPSTASNQGLEALVAPVACLTLAPAPSTARGSSEDPMAADPIASAIGVLETKIKQLSQFKKLTKELAKQERMMLRRTLGSRQPASPTSESEPAVLVDLVADGLQCKSEQPNIVKKEQPPRIKRQQLPTVKKEQQPVKKTKTEIVDLEDTHGGPSVKRPKREPAEVQRQAPVKQTDTPVVIPDDDNDQVSGQNTRHTKEVGAASAVV